MAEKSNREDGEEEDIFQEDETKNSNQDDGDGSDNASGEEESRKALDAYNKEMQKRGLNVNFKSWDDVEKSKREADSLFAKQGGKKQEEKQEHVDEVKPQSNVIKSLFFKANPEAEVIWDEVEKAAKLTGRDAFDLYSEESYLQEKAKSRYEARQAEEEAKSKIADPSNGGKPFGNRDWSKLSDEEVENLSPKEYEKYREFRKGQSKSGGFIFD